MQVFLSGIGFFCFFFSSRRRHTRCLSDWSSDVCSSDLERLFLSFGIRNTTLILAQTQYQRERLAETFPNAPVQVLPNFHPTPPDGGRSGAVMKQVAWIANLKPLKNPGAFVRLARRFAHRSDVHFVIVGGPMAD